MNWQKFVSQNLSTLQDNNSYRQIKKATPINSREIELDGQKLINFSSNDYLAMRFHPKVIGKGQEYAEKYAV